MVFLILALSCDKAVIASSPLVCLLPLDVVAEITKHTRRIDLVALAAVCRTYRDVAQRALFRNITFDTVSQQVLIQFVRVIKGAVTSKERRKFLAGFVRNVHFGCPDQDTVTCASMMTYFSTIIPRLTHLKSICMSSHYWNSWDTLVKFQSDVTPKLPAGFEQVIFYVGGHGKAQFFKADMLSFQNGRQGMLFEDPMQLTCLDHSARWQEWFSNMSNVSVITIVTAIELWVQMPALETIRQWACRAPDQLQKIEFWSHVEHVQFTDDHHLGRVWVQADKKSQRVMYAFAKDANGMWDLLVADSLMESAPNISLEMCFC